MRKFIIIMLEAMLLPQLASAQGFPEQISGLHGVLDQLYTEMIPLCSKLISVGRGIAGFAAIWYIASRIWRHLASAEPIDFYPLLRPFVLGFAILIFPSVLALINGIMSPAVRATSSMVKGSNDAITLLLKKKEEAIKKTNAWQMYVGVAGAGDRDKWYKYTHGNEDASGEGIFGSIGNDIKFSMAKASYNFRNSIKEWMSEVLRVLFEAAALCINTIRTFHLVVLAIIGPIAFGIAVFDGFQHTLTGWIARYINIYLWLPVANIFGAIIGRIQQKMIALDIKQVQDMGDTFFSATDMAYLIFLIIGIVGYFSVPSVANYIIHAGGGNALLYKVTSLFASTATAVGNKAFPAGGGFGSYPRNQQNRS
ncbi:MAG: conjugative transposon protein TraJ [Dyadobacter sp. 50-39]|uniref:conjugative transposon protein TraJ n=1 Tax=Dyadobacter sp. 50-39 TaxID=1895756 RepID=UPI000961D3A1|nr:conjugative transposon protein TraJ [Dyadobacter sp. 50-39]OJV19770.1 MAG: conjugative transposon protein TraJ [Dyadobacter sp. 50-39]